MDCIPENTSFRAEKLCDENLVYIFIPAKQLCYRSDSQVYKQPSFPTFERDKIQKIYANQKSIELPNELVENLELCLLLHDAIKANKIATVMPKSNSTSIYRISMHNAIYELNRLYDELIKQVDSEIKKYYS